MRLEAKIGLFVIMGLVSLFLLSTQVNSFKAFDEGGCDITLDVNDASGITVDSKVFMNGVKVGTVTNIQIIGRVVTLTLTVNESVKIPEDSVAIITQESVLGTKVINIEAGYATTYVGCGTELKHSKRLASFEQTSDSINETAIELQMLIRDFREVLDKQSKENIKAMLSEFRRVGENINRLVETNEQNVAIAIENFRDVGKEFKLVGQTINKDLPGIMGRIDSLTKKIDLIANDLEQKLPVAVDKFINIEDNVTVMLEENRESLKSTINNADEFFGKGAEAVDKIDSVLSNFTVSELQVHINGYYMFEGGYTQGNFGGAYLPNPETYYMIDLITTPDFSDESISDPIARHQKGKLYFSAQYGKRFRNILIRGGIIQSTAGVGVDYFMYNDKWKLSLDAFDFNSVNNLYDSNPNLTFTARYLWLKHIEIYAGWSNFVNGNRYGQSVFAGLGIYFVDNNLKYLAGAAGSAF